MHAAHDAHDEQAALWNGIAGCAWVEMQEPLDKMLKPFEEILVEAVCLKPRRDVLDVGCGTGSTTVAVSRVLGENGSSTGIDISETMIAASRSRGEKENSSANFICANAQTHAFESSSFDMIISRFGVMFLNDPVRAFANLRSAPTEDAELRFVAWRSAAENLFMTSAERAAAPLLPGLPDRRPNAPGQFAFADKSRVHMILEESGWAEINIWPIDRVCTLPEKDLVPYLTRLGPVGLVLHKAGDQTRAKVIETIRAAFDSYVNGANVRFTSACWVVRARPARGRRP